MGSAKKLMGDLKWNHTVAYDEKDAVGRRYRRQDALGTPYCITIDHQTLEDQTVTLRDRDSMQQERVPLDAVEGILNEKLDIKNWLKHI